MVLRFRDAGTLKVPKAVWTKSSNILVPVQKVNLRHNGAWQAVYQNEVVVNLPNTSSSIVLKAYFTEDQWADPNLKKRVVVPAGIQIGGNNNTYVIAPTYSAGGQAGSWAGQLTLENRGTISGIGGVPNAGVGGSCIWMNFPGRSNQLMIINNYGTIRAGGGAGGHGGTGGNGYYVQSDPYTYVEGPRYHEVYGVWTDFGYFRWDETVYYSQPGNGWYYYPGSYVAGGMYYIYRSQTRYNTYNVYTSGGGGGNGGRGQGFDGGNAAGANGAGGGTNAGTGGKGGTGGTYGNWGGTGNTGGSGNNGGGSGGQAGGAPGYVISSAVYATLNNYGTIQGR